MFKKLTDLEDSLIDASFGNRILTMVIAIVLFVSWVAIFNILLLC